MDNPLRIGILGLDTSHSVAFARILNNPDQPEDAAALGGRITHAWADRAKGDMAATVEERREELTSKWGVAMVRKPTEMVGKVDAVMVLAVNGADHARLARPSRRGPTDLRGQTLHEQCQPGTVSHQGGTVQPFGDDVVLGAEVRG